jgi:protein transport protein SEC31
LRSQRYLFVSFKNYSCGKDNRTILWDLFSLQPIADIPTDKVEQQVDNTNASSQEMFASSGLASSQQRRYNVQWSPIKRGIALTCSLDRKVQAHSILGLSGKSGRPPKWMRPSSSVSCGFGGAVVSCGAKDRYVRMKTFVEEPELEILSRDFESIIESTNVVEYCHERATKASDNGEAQLWSFMQVMFDANARQQLLGMLGFDPETIADKAYSYSEDNVAAGVKKLSVHDKNATCMSVGTEEMVKRALVVGNFEAAVECCFQTENLADALVLASCGGAELWKKTQERYFQSQTAKRSFLPVVSAVIRDEVCRQNE